MAFDLDPSYKQVPERIADFKEKHPDGCLRPLNPEKPYWVETIGDKTYIVYAAAAFRTPDDPTPGVGIAWEPFPGKTPYTRESELQNAETSAWGRAIVAVLASESKAIASAEDIRNRREESAPPETQRVPPRFADRLVERINHLPDDLRLKCKTQFAATFGKPAELKRGQADAAEALVASFEVGDAEPPEGKGADTPPAASVSDQPARALLTATTAPALSPADDDRHRKRVNAVMSEAGITDNQERHALIRYATGGAAESSKGLSAEQVASVVTTVDQLRGGDVVMLVALDGAVTFAAAQTVGAQ